MAKKPRSTGNGNPDNKAPVSPEVTSSSGPAGEGGAQPYVNEHGDLCIGNECFNLSVDTEHGEVRVTINRDECGAELQQTLDALHMALGRGARTVYETRSESK